MAFLQAFTPKNTSKSRQKTPKITLNFNLRVSIFNFYIFPTIFHNFPNFQCSVFTMIWRSFVHNKKSETTKLFIFVELQNFPFFFTFKKVAHNFFRELFISIFAFMYFSWAFHVSLAKFLELIWYYMQGII